MNIYSFPTFNLTKVLYTAEELGMDYQLHLLDATKGEHKTPEHLQRHPLGKVPAIKLNGKFFFESHSICRLLAEENGNRLYANSPARRGIVNQWIDLMGFHIGRWIIVHFFEEVIKPKGLGKPADQANIDEAAGFLEGQLPVLESVLQRSAYITGAEITIADTIAFAICQTHELTSLNFDSYPGLLKWYQSMSERPAIGRALAKLPGRQITPFPA